MIICRLPVYSGIGFDVALENCYDIKCEYKEGYLHISWADPNDLYYKNGVKLAEWFGTRLVANTLRPPQNENDGTVLVTNRIHNYYTEHEYVYGPIEAGELVHFALFPFNRRFKYTYSEENQFDGYGGYIHRFWDGDTLLKTEYVNESEYAYPPVVEDDETGHPFDKWEPEIEEAHRNQDYYVTRKAIVNYWNFDGSELLNTEYVSKGQAAIYAEQPERPESDSHTYTFAGWATSVDGEANSTIRDAVTDDLDLYAAYESEIKSFIVRFISEGDVVDTQTVTYGSVVSYNGEPITADKSGLHDFDGWNRDLNVPITGHTDIYSTFKHRVSYFDSQTHVIAVEQVKDGADATLVLNPTMPSTAEFDYVYGHFADVWKDPVEDQFTTSPTTSLTNIKSDVEVFAAFKAVRKEYEIVINYNGTSATLTKKYGESLDLSVYEVENSEGREFYGWDKEVDIVTGPESITAVYKYFVNLYNSSENLLSALQVGPGETVPFPESVTFPDGDYDNYSYSLLGWANGWTEPSANPSFVDLTNIPVTSDIDLYAVFRKADITYPVTFYGPDGEVYRVVEVVRGKNAVLPVEPPVKENDSKYRYEFRGWSLEDDNTVDADALLNIQAPRSLYPCYEAFPLAHTVNFYVEGELYDTVVVEHGQNAELSKPDPTKESTVDKDFHFEGWSIDEDNEVDEGCTEGIVTDLNLYAVFSSTAREYPITWTNSDDSQIDVTYVAYGQMPTHADPQAPELPERHEFTGWEPSLHEVDGPATYKATYHKITVNPETNVIEDSLDEINDALKDGTYPEKYPIGSLLEVDQGEQGTIHYEVVGHDLDTIYDGGGTAPLTLVAKEVLTTSKAWNESGTTEGGYAESDVRRYVDEEVLYGTVPEDLRLMMVTVNKDGEKLKYWLASKDELLTSYELDPVKKDVNSSLATDYWTRDVSDGANAVMISNSGTEATAAANTPKGIVPGFCLDYLDKETMIHTVEFRNGSTTIGTVKVRHHDDAVFPPTLTLPDGPEESGSSLVALSDEESQLLH